MQLAKRNSSKLYSKLGRLWFLLVLHGVRHRAVYTWCRLHNKTSYLSLAVNTRCMVWMCWCSISLHFGWMNGVTNGTGAWVAKFGICSTQWLMHHCHITHTTDVESILLPFGWMASVQMRYAKYQSNCQLSSHVLSFDLLDVPIE